MVAFVQPRHLVKAFKNRVDTVVWKTPTQRKTKTKNKIERFKLWSRYNFVHSLGKEEKHLSFKLSMLCLVSTYLSYLLKV